MEVGPWTPIGTPSLTIPNYRPDFNAKPRPDVTPIKLLRITKAAYEHRVQSGVGAPPEHLSSRHSSRSNVCRSRNNSAQRDKDEVGVTFNMEEPSPKPETDDSNLLHPPIQH